MILVGSAASWSYTPGISLYAATKVFTSYLAGVVECSKL